jgi:YVTN family beta-propeller protein
VNLFQRVSRVLLALTTLAAAPTCAQTVIATVHVGYSPQFLAINRTTNTIYVSNHNDNTVTLINGNTNGTLTVPIGSAPGPLAVNPTTNLIYTSLSNSNSLAVINGTNLQVHFISTGRNPWMTTLDSIRNRIYATDPGDATVAAVDGGTEQTHVVPVGSNPVGLAVNPATNFVYISDNTSGVVTAMNGSNFTTSSLPAGSGASAMAVDALRNKIYVANSTSSTVSVIDGSTNQTTLVPVGTNPVDLALNVVTDQIYVANQGDSTVTVIDGTTLATGTIYNVGGLYKYPQHLVLDQVNNQIYVLNGSLGVAGSVYRIDGATNIVSSPVTVGHCANNLALNEVTHRLYVSNGCDNSVSVLAVPGTPSRFVAVPPCRVVDTRNPDGPFGGPAIAANSSRAFIIPLGGCNIPPVASAYSLNLTVAPHGPLGFVTVWPYGLDQPSVSTLNSFDGRVKANALLVPSGADFAISVFATDTADVVLDITGFFQPLAYFGALSFYPVTPCRVVDTRNPNGPLGGPYIGGNRSREFPVLSSNCKLPHSAQAYSMNLTAVPHGPLGYLTVWPSDRQQPLVSTLNSFSGTITANAAIVPAASNGDISAFVTNDSDLIIDVNGYFAPPAQGGLSLYPMSPCRVFDSQFVTGAFAGELTVPVAASPCEPPTSAQSYVFNATAIPQGSLGFLSLWPDGQQQPLVSTLNAPDGAISSNMAIVSTSNGAIDAYASSLTNLIVDISGFFAP